MDVAFSEDLSKGAALGEEKAIPGKGATTYQTHTGKKTAKTVLRGNVCTIIAANRTARN